MAKALRVRLKPADPFDLIRLLARSQSDPRKAVAELVQNSLDAGATEITVTRRGRTLWIVDNGEGVLPSMARTDALQYLATHVGHSVKRHLTPEERYRLLQQGQYGIGLLGFWSIGRQLSMRTRVAGSDVWSLNLEEDRPHATVGKDRGQKILEATWTEIVIRDIHPAAQRLITGRKIADYLALELRGQILQRGARVRVHHRGDYLVRPPRFQGVPIPLSDTEPLRAELYWLPEEHGPGGVALSVAGTTVLDSIEGWERMTGVIDAPFLDVAPGSRRGYVPNEKAERFHEVLATLRAQVDRWLAKFEEARAREADRAIHARLRSIFRGLAKRLPQYELFPVEKEEERVALPAAESSEEAPELYEPGPLATVRIVPASCRLAVGTVKTFTARAEDASGRAIREGVTCAWTPDRTFRADHVGVAAVAVEARQGDRVARAEARIEVVQELDEPGREDIGIPEPVEVKDPSGRWRSRVLDGRWEFNGSHPDYLLAAAGDGARRVRYLASLLAKELVLRQVNGAAAEDRLLEALVELLTAIEERISGKRRV